MDDSIMDSGLGVDLAALAAVSGCPDVWAGIGSRRW